MKNAILVPGRPDKDLHYDHGILNNRERYHFNVASCIIQSR